MMTTIDEQLTQVYGDEFRYYTEYFSSKDKAGIASFFMGGDAVLGAYDVGVGESRREQYQIYRTRLRAITDALAAHPLADHFSESIAILRAMVAEGAERA